MPFRRLDTPGADMGAIIAAFAALQEGVTVIDRSGVVRAANPAAERILGVQADAIPGSSVENPVGEAFFADGTPLTAENAISLQVLRTGRPANGVTLRFRTPTGGERWLEAAYQPLFHPGQPQPWAVLSSFADITERRAEQAALAARERDYRLLAENATDMIARADPDGIYIYVSPACRDLLGYEPEEMVGRHAFDFLHPDDLAGIQQARTRILESDELVVTEARRRRKDGSYIWVETTVRSIRDPQTGVVRETQSSARDISTRKRIEEELRRSNGDLEQFAAAASHDLASPLTTIAGFADLLRTLYQDGTAADPTQLVERIIANTQRMRQLIDDLLSLSHVGHSDLRFRAVSLAEVIAEVRDLLAGPIGDTGARLSATELPTVSGDRSQLVRLFQNLIGNALKFVAPDTAPDISITARRDGPETWLIDVSDRGIGLPASALEQAFEPFCRLHAGERYAGSGLGLALCRRITRAHHGDITAAARAGGGTTFTVSLPSSN